MFFECFLSVFECFESILMWKRHNLNTFDKNITNSRDSDELFQLLAHFVSIILKKKLYNEADKIYLSVQPCS